MSVENKESDGVVVDPLFVGLTRPATMWGVPLHAFIVEFMSVALIFLAVGNPMYLLLGVPAHAFLYLLSADNPWKFEAAWIWVITFGRSLNTKYWGSASFSPLSQQKWRE